MIAKYSKKFPYAPYLNEDIGYDISIPDNASDEEMIEAIVRLNRVATAVYHKLNPHMVSAPSPIQGGQPTPSVIDYKAKERIEIAIDNAETEEEVRSYMQDAIKNDLQVHYVNKLCSFKTKNK